MRRPIQHAMACHLRLWGILQHVDPCGFVVSQLLNHPNNAKTPKIMEALSEGLQLHVAEFWFIVQPHSPMLSRGIGISRACVWTTPARIWHVTDNGPFHSDKAFLSNTAIVTMMIPVIVSWSRTLGVHPGKLLMPLSFAAARQQWRLGQVLGGQSLKCIFVIFKSLSSPVYGSCLDMFGMGLCYRLNLEDLAHWLALPTAWWHGRVWTSHCTRWAFRFVLQW